MSDDSTSKKTLAQQTLALADGLADGRVDRRSFVRGALALGLGLPSIAAVLQACSGSEAPPETPKAPTGAAVVKPAGPPDLGELEKELKIYNWSDYIAEDTVANFEKESGVKVTYDTFESNEELIAKLQAGASGYDLVCPSGYAVQVLLALKLLEELRPKYIPNLGNVAPQFRKMAFDPTDAYAVPWQWGMTGIAYRADKVKAPPDSWAVFHDAQYKGKMTMMDDMRDVIGAWLKFRGKSLNSSVPEDLAAAKADALTAKALLQSYVSAPVKGQLVAGDVWIAQLWNGDTLQAKAENDKIDWILPKEGGVIWADSMVIPKGAPNPRAAHAFLDYILRADVGAAISDFTGYGSPNAAATAKMAKPVPYPTEEQMKLLEFQSDLAGASGAWDQIWTEIKAG
ncbi:MAG: spermidine/putrescine ABC transporter substrate-binding protein [Pseudomonadota bacterium]|nr:spermidine/putrescine ABC transporter substrate-binding protein [Pseudomonadota bacterium]